MTIVGSIVKLSVPSLSDVFVSLTFKLVLICFVSGCATNMAQQEPKPKVMTAQEILAIAMPVVDYEWKAVGQYDYGHATASELAQHIMGYMCR
jgi:hypothetical protein